MNEETTTTVRDLALTHGQLPATRKGDRVRPVRVNKEHWKLRAACAVRGWTLDSVVAEEEYLRAIDEVANAQAR